MADATYVRLSISESGTLYHVLLRALMDAGADLENPKPEERFAVYLLKKIGRANDYCMGKGA